MASGSRAEGGSIPPPYAPSPTGGFDSSGEQRPHPEAGAAWGRLLARYGPLAARLARGIVASAAEAEDVVQDAVRGLLERAAAGEVRFESEEHARNYFLRAVHNRAVDVLREGERRPAPLEAPPSEACVAVADGMLELEEREENAQALHRLHRALLTLPAGERELLRLRYAEGLAYREIAARTGAPISTLHSRIAAALTRIRGRFGKEGLRP